MSDEKVWEETWEADNSASSHSGVFIQFRNGVGGRVLAETFNTPRFTGYAEPGVMLDRAKLAAAAPEMARLLLEAQWASFGNYGSCSACPWCASENNPRHEPDCELVAVLKKAGVL